MANPITAVQSSNPTSPIRIGIMGTPVESGNRGVLALGEGLARLILETWPQAQIVLFGSHRTSNQVTMRPKGVPLTVPMITWRLSPRSELNKQIPLIVAASALYRFIPITVVRRRLASWFPWIKALEETTIVGDIRGGDSFSDIYGLQRFVMATLPILSVIWVKRDIVLFPQTYGPFKSRTSRFVARWIIRHASVVIARDQESQKIAQELAGSLRKVALSPDVAFALYSDGMASALFDSQPEPSPIPQGAIGLNVNGLMFNGGYNRSNMFGLTLDYAKLLPELITELLKKHPGELLLVPHTLAPTGDVESDNEACQKVRGALSPELQKRVRIVTGNYDCHQLKGIIAQCEFFIGARMHSCIAALSQGVPCVGIAYSMKFRGVFATVDAEDWVVDGRTASNQQTIARILELYQTRTQFHPELLNRADQTKARLRSIFGGLLEPHTHPDMRIR